ncbi:MAG: WG repeat-containing protein [Blastocatellia bacterium]|nr:WG repeat-containing protein [Blastocatellia bacterium]
MRDWRWSDEVIKKDGYLYGGYIDKTGKLVISPEFGHVEEFSEGLALILLDGKWGYIDKTGKLVFKTGFDQAESFRNGRAWVQEGGTGVFDHQNARYGYIDRTGKVIWPPSN